MKVKLQPEVMAKLIATWRKLGWEVERMVYGQIVLRKT